MTAREADGAEFIYVRELRTCRSERLAFEEDGPANLSCKWTSGGLGLGLNLMSYLLQASVAVCVLDDLRQRIRGESAFRARDKALDGHFGRIPAY